MKIGIRAACLHSDLRAAINASRTHGFTGVLLDAAWPGTNLTELSQTGRRELSHLLRTSQLETVGLLASIAPQEQDWDRVIERLDAVMETARGLSAPMICLELGKVSQEVLPMFQELAARADRYGVMIAMSSRLSSLKSLHELLVAAACPWFGIDLDPVAVLSDEWDSTEVFSKLGSLIRHVRARDAMVGDSHRSTPAIIGQGSVNWIEFPIRLDQAGYHGWLSVDTMDLKDRIAGIAPALKVLSALR